MSYHTEMVRHYLACALWSTTNPDHTTDPDTWGECLDENYELDDISEEAWDLARQECRHFMDLTGVEAEGVWQPEQAGHDFAACLVGLDEGHGSQPVGGVVVAGDLAQAHH